jgi:large subunit ribosomal protein L28
MALACEICGKKPRYGNTISHAHNVTRRRWNPNLRRVRAVVGGMRTHMHISTACIKSGRVMKAAWQTRRRIAARRRYALLSKVYNDSWMRELGYADQEVTLTALDVIGVNRQNGNRRELVTVGPNRSVFQALQTMQQQDISQLPIFEEGRSVGSLFEDKILNLALQGKDLRKLIVREVMGPPLPQSSLERAGRARHPSAEPRKPGGVCRNGVGRTGSAHEVRFDGHDRWFGDPEALKRTPPA